MNIAHLPEEKQKEIADIVKRIADVAGPEKIILFGSHARGNWVEDHYVSGGVRYSYISDYDFLVVIPPGSGKREETIASEITNRCLHYRNAVSVLVHDIDYINEGLRIGQYFFTEIIRDGIVLYDTGNTAFAEAKELTEEEVRERSRMYYGDYFPRGEDFLMGAEFFARENRPKAGIFILHQATEAFYHAVLLVHSGYKPKAHNLPFLRNYTKYLSQDLYELFLTPVGDAREKYLFDLLKQGYKESRYKREYRITAGELEALIGKVSRMKAVVEGLCRDRI